MAACQVLSPHRAPRDEAGPKKPPDLPSLATGRSRTFKNQEQIVMPVSKRFSASPLGVLFHDPLATGDPFAAGVTQRAQPLPKEQPRSGRLKDGDRSGARRRHQEARALALSKVARDLERLLHSTS